MDAVEHRTLVGNRGIQEVLSPVLINAEPLKDQPLREARLKGADLKDGVHMQLGGPHGGQVLLHSTPHNGAPAHVAQCVRVWVQHNASA